jgi:hypothetical protein
VGPKKSANPLTGRLRPGRCGASCPTSHEHQQHFTSPQAAAFFHFKTAFFLHLAGRNPGGCKLGQDQPAVTHHPLQPGALDPQGDLVVGEEVLARCTPHVDPARVEHEHPGVDAGKLPAQRVEGELVVCGDEHRRVGGGGTHGIKAWGDGAAVAADTAAYRRGPDAVGQRQSRGDPGHGANRGVDETGHERQQPVARPLV